MPWCDLCSPGVACGIGFSAAAEARVRGGDDIVETGLLIQVQKTLTSRRLTQGEAANVLQVTQPRVSDLGVVALTCSALDALIDMLARLGVGVRLVGKSARAKRVA